MDTGFWVGNVKVNEHWEDLGIDGILKWILRNRKRGYGTDSSGSGHEQVRVMNLQVPQNVVNVWTNWGTCNVSSWTLLQAAKWSGKQLGM